MKRIYPVMVAGILIVAGCTPIPKEYRSNAALPVQHSAVAERDDNSLLDAIAGARIGATLTHVDPLSGLASTLVVTSEYFSANGRSCRRFTQHLSNAAKPGNKLACRAADGWQEIPIASIVE